MGWDGGNGLYSVLISAIKLRQLLTGEGYALLKIFGDSLRRGSLVTVPEGGEKSYNPTPSLIQERKIDEKILELTNKIIELLTGEVPIRYEDITVSFSKEEWDYIERHKDLYKDVMMESTIGDYNNKILLGTSSEKISDSKTADQDSNDVIEKIVHLAKEITHQLTKEKYIIIWNPGNHTAPSGSIADSSPSSLIHKRENDGKILDLTKKIIELLTGEVPIRSQDVTVYFSMEEWEYIEAHKDLYKDVFMDNEIVESYGEKPLECPKLGKDSSESSCVLTHNPLRQVGDAIKSCPNQPNIENRKKNHKKQTPLPCYQCGKPLKTTDIRQQETDAADRSKTLCGKCLLGEKGKDAKTKSFFCIECGRCFSQKGRLNVHLRTHTMSKSFPCSECDKVFTSNAVLETHMRVHTGEKPFPCSECDKVCTNNAALETHMRVHTGEKPYKCSECGKSFSNTGNLQAHYRVHTGEKPFPCSECDKTFRYKSHLVAHQRSHTGQTLPCPECGSRFVYRSHLMNHLRIHTGEKPYKCPECGKSFHRSCQLAEHVMNHTGESSLKCDECDRCFLHPSHLFVHQRTHTGEKPYSCSECGKGFTRSTSLAEHEQIHRGEKPFSCPQCEKLFVKYNYMLRHLETHKRKKS